MNILALDLGTKTGFCWGKNTTGLSAGSWALSEPEEVTFWRRTRLDRTRDPRMRRLIRRVSRFYGMTDMVVFEDVEFSSYTKQNQLWSSFRTAIQLAFCEDIGFECVPVGTLKKFATGHGGATKEMMRAALLKQHPTLCRGDDNAIDAIWIWLWAKHNLSRIVK